MRMDKERGLGQMTPQFCNLHNEALRWKIYRRDCRVLKTITSALHSEPTADWFGVVHPVLTLLPRIAVRCPVKCFQSSYFFCRVGTSNATNERCHSGATTSSALFVTIRMHSPSYTEGVHWTTNGSARIVAFQFTNFSIHPAGLSFCTVGRRHFSKLITGNVEI